MSDKRFDVEAVLDFLLPLFLIEIMVFGNIGIILVLLHGFGVI